MRTEAITAIPGSLKEAAVSHLSPISTVIGNGPYVKKGFLGIDRVGCPGAARETVAMPLATKVEPLTCCDAIERFADLIIAKLHEYQCDTRKSRIVYSR